MSGKSETTEQEWDIRDKADNLLQQRLTGAINVSPMLAQLLINRGITDVEAGRRFLFPTLHQLHDPFKMQDMEKAVQRVRQALEEKEKILVYGDYDADGVSATALLVSFFRMLGADVQPCLSNRFESGYGLDARRVQEAVGSGVNLIITVDCGTSDIEAISCANEAGADTIVTDHHEPGEQLPAAVAILNSKVAGSGYPFRELAGVGVAFKLAWAVANSLSGGLRVSPQFKEFLLDALALVALGTVADVVPLIDENRVFVRYGLRALEATERPGLRALLIKAGLSQSAITSEHIAFRLAPRLNAAGRLESADEALALLLADSLEAGRQLATRLDQLNRKRQTIVKQVFKEAVERIEKDRLHEKEKMLILADEGWHPGVIGIAASRLTERYHRPVILISFSGEVGAWLGSEHRGRPATSDATAVQQRTTPVRRTRDGRRAGTGA